MAVLWTALWMLLGLLAMLVMLLAVPLEIAFDVQARDGGHQGEATLDWLFGLVHLRLRGRPRGFRRPSRRRRRRPGGRGRLRRLTALLRDDGFGRRLLGLARKLLRRVRIRELGLRVRLGLDDPADTGRLWAAVGPVSALLSLPLGTRIAIEPDFTGATFEADGAGRVRFVPIQLLGTLLGFLLTPANLRVLLRARRRPA